MCLLILYIDQTMVPGFRRCGTNSHCSRRCYYDWQHRRPYSVRCSIDSFSGKSAVHPRDIPEHCRLRRQHHSRYHYKSGPSTTLSTRIFLRPISTGMAPETGAGVARSAGKAVRYCGVPVTGGQTCVEFWQPASNVASNVASNNPNNARINEERFSYCLNNQPPYVKDSTKAD